MNNMKMLAVAGVVVLVVLVAGAFLLSNKSQTTNQNQNTGNTNVSTSAAPTAASTLNEEAMITVTKDGFDPSTLNVKVGQKVTWVNNSGSVANVSSDVHPTHLLFPFLNLGSFADGGTVSVTIDKAGTFTYHNHLDASMKGTIVAK